MREREEVRENKEKRVTERMLLISMILLVEADKHTALAQGNPVLKANPHVIPLEINVVSFIIQIVMVLVDFSSELKCISAYYKYCI